jgi:hypothetical protein
MAPHVSAEQQNPLTKTMQVNLGACPKKRNWSQRHDFDR